MKFAVVVAVLCVFSAVSADESCSSSNCDLSDGCVCASKTSPIQPASDGPQLVLLTFDDAARADIYTNIYEPLLNDRKNPDGENIGATFFVPHEYTDYSIVNRLYNKGHEIGVHSISKREADYWAKADVEQLVAEIKGQKTIISQQGNIPSDDIRGARIPQLQLTGDKTFTAYQQSEIVYDSTWTSLSSNRLFPYTLHHSSSQQCLIGECPVESYNGIWVVPINNIQGIEGLQCNSLLGCQIVGTPEEVSEWLTGEFKRNYEGLNAQRSPFKLLINFSWLSSEDNFKGLQMFLDNLQNYSDVFVVTEWEAIQWRRNPVTTAEYKTSRPARGAECADNVCELPKGTEIRYMVSCNDCPTNFPWVDNPEGN